jgi:enhanced filamentous growth protein 1
VSGERLPALTQVQSQGPLSAGSSPRNGSYSSSVYHSGSVSSATSYAPSVNGENPLKTPPETSPTSYRPGSRDQETPYGFGVEYQHSMNQIGSYHHPEVHTSSMATTHAHPPVTGPGAMSSHYAQYPSIMQSSHQPYSSSPAQYSPYGYTSYSAAPPVTSSMQNLAATAPMQSIPGTVSTLPGTPSYAHTPHTPDQTGQIAPPGVKPRVTATLWEDEGSLCFQVEAKGICVARREDNHMINGTKLLNVAGMTRGRRDGILKSEKMRHVVKIGPMHLKGVWIPFDRALDFANREKITEMLYPLFVHDIGALLYHPSNPAQGRPGLAHTTQALQAFDRKREQQQRIITASQPQTPQGPPMQPVMSQAPASAGATRPQLDRAHTFPTPPASASSVQMNAQGAPYESWNGNVGQQLSIDTGLSNQRSVPNTPASTPPGKATQGATHYPTPQSYDTSRPTYSNAATQGQYASQPVRFGGPLQPGFKGMF